MLAQFRLALTKISPLFEIHFKRGASGDSELAINPVGLTNKYQGDGGWDHHNHSSPHEAAQEIGQRGGHEAAVVCGLPG